MTGLLPGFPAVPGLASFLALIHTEGGRLGEAREVIGRLAATGFDLPADAPQLTFLTIAAEVLRALDDRESAAVLYDLLLPAEASFSVAGGVTTGCTAYYLGVLATMVGRFAEAEEHFAFAGDIHERIGAPAHLGRGRVEWARMRLCRRRPGDVEEARRLLDQALSGAIELGLVNVERRARAVMETTP